MSKEQKYCHRLRELEGAIDRQRKLIARLKAQDLNVAGEQERLTELLAELDGVLRASNDLSKAA